MNVTSYFYVQLEQNILLYPPIHTISSVFSIVKTTEPDYEMVAKLMKRGEPPYYK